MQLSFAAVVLALTVGALAQIGTLDSFTTITNS